MALSLFDRLLLLRDAGAVISEVYVVDTQHEGEPDLLGVTVEEVAGNYVVFRQNGSGGIGRIIVVIDKIVAIDV